MSDPTPEYIEINDTSWKKLTSGYLAPIVLLIVSTILIVPFLLPYFLDAFNGNAAPLDADAITREQLVPALITTFAAEFIVVIGFLWFAGDRRRWRSVLGFENFSWRSLKWGPLLGIMFFLGLLAIEALANKLGLEVGSSDTVNQFSELNGILRLFVLFVAVPILAPLFEEIFFRGLMLGHLLEGHGGNDKWSNTAGIVAWSVLYSSFWFSLAHFQGASSLIDFVVLLWTFLFACSACVLRIKLRSLYPCMAAHGTYNFISALAIALT